MWVCRALKCHFVFAFFSPIFVTDGLIYKSPFCNVPKTMERKSIHFNFAFHMKHIQA